ncbi:cytidylate kinase [Sulfurihydrogenibium azorense Az-Fu1]|uniref:Cytidylate kinase n=1 Tax=Sulfurihydrogenibium azorense (strain DSM 15241 / OCM 825 / Az-Fu1) TaxID=204536 RepID=C1DXI3_SULAA|nr:(d)CMP kinase [Sulfurihydrogenibium azorense]ACN98197.1 cytidylate kinase [Sulfurihydrogenibium azorense Az-Fu1]
MIIAIDGPAGSGKSTIAKLLAKKLGFTYIDTGAMYRALALKVINLSLDPNNEEEVLKVLENTKIDLVDDKVFLDGQDVSAHIRTEEVGNVASIVARYKKVREEMVNKQRQIGINAKNAVIEGRDAGTKIFPDADLKIFMTASPEVRAQRRVQQLKEKGFLVDYNHILQKIIERDKMDYERKESPLRPTQDYIIIDTTDKTIEEVISYIENLIKK